MLLACSGASSDPNLSPPSTVAASDAGHAPAQIFVDVYFVKIDPERFGAVAPSRARDDFESVLFDLAGAEVVSSSHVLAADGQPATLRVTDTERSDAAPPFQMAVLAQVRANKAIHCDVGVVGSPADFHTAVDVADGQWIVMGGPGPRDMAGEKQMLVAFKATIVRSNDDLQRLLREKLDRRRRFAR